MIRLLLATVCCTTAWPASPESCPAATAGPSAARTADDKAIKALDAWLKLYRSGKMQLRSSKDWKPVAIDAKDSIAIKFGLAPKAGLGLQTWAGDLELILDATVKLDSAEAVQALLDVAAIGLDQAVYTREMAPFDVRDRGEAAIARMNGEPAVAEVMRAARGELKTDKGRAAAVQAAALRCLGATRKPVHRPILESQLAARDIVVRVHAAEALAALGDEAAASALAAQLEREESDMVLPAVAQALRTLFGKRLQKPGGGAAADAPAALPESARSAVRAAIKSLGRTTWRADMALLALLDDFRSVESVPALIGVLERFRDHPEELQSGKLSGLLLHRAHELLVAMTGAVFPAAEPEKWRELWEREKDKIEVTKERAPQGQPTTVASGFCGIPVQGSRVIFILDLSRSMTFKMNKSAGTTSAGKRAPEPEGSSTRLDFARRELERAMDLIAPNASFNLISFNGDEKAVVWSKDMVPANEKNRDRFRKHLAKIEADGGTNLWSALEVALKIKSLVYGSRYETNVDEIFILSDGAPSVGEVLDPIEILRLVKESNRFAGMRINTIFISSNNTEERQQQMPWMSITPEELMKRMAEENGGKFVNL